MRNREKYLWSMIVFLLLLCSFTQNLPQSAKKTFQDYEIKEAPSAGKFHFHQLKSKIFGNTRTIRVLLPPGYSDPENKKKHYPVLYLNDGQNLFDISSSVFNSMEWQVDETVQDLIRKGDIEPLIVVGIDNAGKSGRANEYLPYPDKYLRPFLPEPQGYKYPTFLMQEILPFINRRYRTETGAQAAALGGSSYGALISLYTFIKNPESFGRLLLESPSFYVHNGQILKEAEKLRKLPQKIYMGVGTNEEGRENCVPGDLDNEAVQDVLKLKKILQDKKLDENRLKITVEDCSVHNERAWARRLPEALTFLFGKD